MVDEVKQTAKEAGWPRDSTRNTVVVAVALSLVCSVLVSAAAVYLRPLQERNAELNRQKIILEVAGLLREGASVGEQFRAVEARVVELGTGKYVDGIDPAVFDMRAAARDPATSTALGAVEDIAGIGRRPDNATVYLVRPNGQLQYIILPVYGYGLWSTMYGFIALESDGNTIAGLQFYEHAETPGLGAEVDNPKWRAQWRGKMVYGDDDTPKIELVRGSVTATDESARYEVDGLAGSTLTSRGVTNLLHYWLGEEGFAPYLRRVTDAEDRS